MNNYQINVNQLQAGAKVYIEGEVSFSRIARHVEGEELMKDSQRRKSRGMSPIDKPYTSITIQNARIRPQNPSQLSLAEMYVQERFYTSSSDTHDEAHKIKYYAPINKSPFLPNVSQFNPADNTASQVDLDGKELATGLKVILCMSVYQSKSYQNKGIGLDGIIVMEPIRYYTNNNQDLSALGITYKPLPGDEARAAVTPNGHLEPAMTAPTMTPVSEPVGNQFSSQAQAATPVMPTQAAPVMNAPATPAMNAPIAEPASPWICPNCGNTNAAGMNFCGSCGSKKQENGMAVNNPYAQNVNPAQPTPGIVYDANDTNRQY